MSKSPRVTIVLVIACALLAAIGSESFAQTFMERFRAQQQAASEVYPTPENLAGDPSQNGLLLIDASMSRPMNNYALVGAAIADATTPNERVLAGGFHVRGFPPRESSTAIFANLKPGTYRILRMRFWNVNGLFWVDPPLTESLTVEVRAGTVSYIGLVSVSQRMFSTAINYQVERDQQREAEAWRQVLAKFADSPWTAIIQAHVSSLQ